MKFDKCSPKIEENQRSLEIEEALSSDRHKKAKASTEGGFVNCGYVGSWSSFVSDIDSRAHLEQRQNQFGLQIHRAHLTIQNESPTDGQKINALESEDLEIVTQPDSQLQNASSQSDLETSQSEMVSFMTN